MASSTGASDGGRRRGQRGADESGSNSKKKQKDRANQESREAKRAAAAADTKKDVFMDWKQNVDEVIVRLRCSVGVLKVEDVYAAFSDTACQVRFPDGCEWSCHLYAEIESSCSKILFKEKGGILQLVLHKKIPFNSWPSLMVRANEPVNISAENGKEYQPPASRLHRAAEATETCKLPSSAPPASAEQKRNKPDRGIKRGMKTKPVERVEGGAVKPAEGIRSSSKVDPTPEPSAKRTVRPAKSSMVVQSPKPETLAKPSVNGKTPSSVPLSPASSPVTCKDNRVAPHFKDCEHAAPLTMDKKPESNVQVRTSLKSTNGHSPAGERGEQKTGCDALKGIGNAPKTIQSHLRPGKPPPAGESKIELAPPKNAVEEEKRDKSKEEPQEASREEEKEPMVNLALVKNDSYEKGTDLMVVNVYMKGICRETSRVLFREQDFTLIFQTRWEKVLTLTDCLSSVDSTLILTLNLIQPDLSSYAFTPSRIDIMLKKRHSQRWGGLEAQTSQGAVGGAKVAVPSSPSSLDKSQPGSSQHALPSKEEPRAGEEKAKPPHPAEEGGLESVGPRAIADHTPIKQEAAITTPKPTCMVQPMTHGPPASSERSEEEEQKKVCLPGFTGLVNLGNTCFMNSVIQSLSNTRELRDYFHDRAFETEINCSNPLGTGGRLAIGFAVLLRALWKGTHHAFQPSKLKAIVASKASQFTGYAQHDAQEFMAFLLDGLHEDLNRIQSKPYTETVDSDGRQDEVVAEEAWQRHKMRNDSFIVDLFQGQYKSKLVCPVCSKVSITFDPFLYLPVPLPQKQKVLTVFYFAKEPHKKPIKFLVSISKENSSTAEVLDSISRSVRIKPENLRLAEVIKNRFQRIFLPSHSLDKVSSSDMLFCFEILSKELAKERVLLLRVQQRPQIPSIPIAKCAACQKPPLSEEEKLRRCTRCYRVGYCNQTCQKNHWPTHKTQCRPNVENVGLPFLISVPESRLTYARLAQLLEGYSRFSVNVFQPPFQSGRSSPESSQSHSDLPLPCGPEDEPQVSSTGHAGEQRVNAADPLQATGQAAARSAGELDEHSSLTELSSTSRDPLEEKETSCEKAVKPEVAVAGFQQPSEGASSHTSQFYISILDSNNKEQKLEDKSDTPLEIPEDCTMELVWKNNERLKEYVLVRTKELECEEDPGSASETARAGHFTLEQCLNLFTKPEVLAPEEAWYCPKCQQHREASKQLLLWRLPNVLIIQLKRFSFRSFIWRDKINDMVDFPVRNFDLSKFCIGQKEDVQQPPIYDLYAVINHYGGMIGGHYTAYARLPNDKNSQRSDVGWRLFDDSTVTTVEESQVVTRYAYVLFYRRRNSPVERPPRFLGPLGAEASAAAGAAASQASSEALFGTDLDPGGPPQLTPEVASDLFVPSGECSAPSYSNMEEVD
uniref:ubiquitinyl hydrolase 1 n=1 Tax=Denticeps clupeoides TaxID=299321 RepID=A0AAY4EGR7_9TELE